MMPDFHIPGPHLHTNSGSIGWTCPGVYAEAILNGSGFELCVKGEGRALRVSIDGKPFEVFPLPTGVVKYRWTDLPKGQHLIRIQTICQDAHGFFEIISCNSLLEGMFGPAPQPRKRHLEFVGDSWSSGYGNRSSEWLDSDCTLAFPALVAQALDADYSLFAISGFGIAKNFGEIPPSADSLVDRYPEANSTLQQNPVDQVFVLAGENDFSFSPIPTTETFVARYRELLQKVRTRHPKVQLNILVVERPHDAAKFTEQVYLEELRAGNQDVHMIRLPNLNPLLPLGFQWHPSLAHHQELAQNILNQLPKI